METVYTAWIEIPVKVYCEVQKEERATRHYPGCPATIGLERIEICQYNDEDKVAGSLKDLEDSIVKGCQDKFEEDAWDYI